MALLITQRLTTASQTQIRKKQACFCPPRGCINHSLRYVRNERNIKSNVDRLLFFLISKVLLVCISFINIINRKYESVRQTVYKDTTGCVTVQDVWSSNFLTASGVRQEFSLSPFLFSFVTWYHELLFRGYAKHKCRLIDSNYIHNSYFSIVAMLPTKTLTKTSEVIPLSEILFAPTKCKAQLQDHLFFNNTLILKRQPKGVNKFTYL